MLLIGPDSPYREGYESLVEQIFHSPKQICEGEYITIYEFLLLNPEVRNDPKGIADALKEFAGWTEYMLKQMRELGLIE